MSTRHVVPLNDIIEHDTEGTGCICGPRVEFNDDNDMVIVHNSLDGREKRERKEEAR